MRIIVQQMVFRATSGCTLRGSGRFLETTPERSRLGTRGAHLLLNGKAIRDRNGRGPLAGNCGR